MKIRSRNSIGGLALTMVLALSSCSILPPAESPNIYVLPQPASAPAGNSAPKLAWQLRVDTPEANGMLADTGIVVMPEPGRITVYKDARWSDSAPLLLRERLIDAFLATHRLPAVTSDDDSMHADFVLAGDLRAFQTEYRNGSPMVVVRFDAQLRRGGSREVLAARSFEVDATPTGVTVPQVVQTFGDACDQLGAQVVEWTLAQGQQAGPPKEDERQKTAGGKPEAR
ncbi:MAG: ABC-type transport auxiliary lipoprotein family protein [Rhodanobacteraceae bacterium]